ncbi:hypothetical protein BHM03_00040617 [Ensete ventricosum]|nr:hypothetical protein BHM03_00040617 [Ensete ventricosum]
MLVSNKRLRKGRREADFATTAAAIGSVVPSNQLQDGRAIHPAQVWMNPTAESSKSKGDRRRPRRRFSEEQIKSMESMFETQTKLEPRQKLQLARELGLQPRQVAIWFQNKRARWKSKQLEREYRALKADYDALLSSFDSLKKEKQLLLQQVTHRRLLVSPSSSFSVDRSPIPPPPPSAARPGRTDRQGRGEKQQRR